MDQPHCYTMCQCSAIEEAKSLTTMNAVVDLPRKPSTSHRQIHITEVNGLWTLLKKFTLTGLRSGYVVLDLPWFTPEQNDAYAGKVNKYYKTCGCSEGTVAGFLGTAVAVAMFLADRIHWKELGITKTALVCGGIVLLFMLLGKAYGLARGKRNLRKVILEILITQKHYSNGNT